MITISNLHFSYKRKKVFDQLDLDMQAGQIYGLLGRNGTGKTTLLKLLSGLLFPKEGKIEVMDFTPSERLPSLLSDTILIGEEQFIPRIPLKKYLSIYAPFYPRFDYDLFADLLKDFDLPETLHLGELSMGAKKKVHIAFGLATGSKILLLDEPTNGLDIPSKKQFRTIMSRVITDDRLVIISTHQVKDIEGLIDNITILENGHLMLQASLGDIMEKLSFELQRSVPSDDECLYYERVPGGYLCLTKNADAQYTQEVELEILFNAIISKPQNILPILKSSTPHEN